MYRFTGNWKILFLAQKEIILIKILIFQDSKKDENMIGKKNRQKQEMVFYPPLF